MGAASRIFARIAQALEHDTYLTTARSGQLPPDGDWTVWVLKAGRGYGKSWAGSQFVRSEVECGRAKNIAIVGATAGDTRDICVEVRQAFWRFPLPGIGRTMSRQRGG
jgi:phage terminase large subunit-like protein